MTRETIKLREENAVNKISVQERQLNCTYKLTSNIMPNVKVPKFVSVKVPNVKILIS
jgi:hypothetical protein